jgi:hypothetical protein
VVNHYFLLIAKSKVTGKIQSGWVRHLVFNQQALHNKTPANKACTGFVGVCGFFSVVFWCRVFSALNRISSRPQTSNANRWATQSKKQNRL